ncbi:MAG: hypothetical protein Q4D42_04390 [Eubacteriales bacterium]|nr:hypothetical protein [Eubacteriales bacterium]
MRKKYFGIVAAMLTVCVLTMSAWAASTSISISKGQSSVTSSTLSGKKGSFYAKNDSSSTEVMQAYGIVDGRSKWDVIIYSGGNESGSYSDSSATRAYKLKIVGNYYCKGSGTLTVT